MDSTVYSKKGLGNGFVSKVDRNIFNHKFINAGPGPGLYKEGRPTLSEKLSKELEEKKYLVQFYKKDEKIVKKEPNYRMGPGDYQPEKALMFQNTFTSSFVTKYQRDAYRRKEKTPGPGNYENQRDIYSPKKYKQGTDWFCKEPVVRHRKRSFLMKAMHELIKFIQVPAAKAPEEAEAPDEQGDNWMFQRGLKDRFGDKGPIVNDKILGPGHYPSDLFYSVEQKYGEKNYVSSAMFMSETERQPFANFDKRAGPNCIVPYLPARKKDTHLNLNNIWVA